MNDTLIIEKKLKRVIFQFIRPSYWSSLVIQTISGTDSLKNYDIVLSLMLLFTLSLQSAQAGGAVALAVMLTVISNITAVFTVPPLITWIIAFDNVRLDPFKLLIKLILTVLPPLLVSHIYVFLHAGVTAWSSVFQEFCPSSSF